MVFFIAATATTFARIGTHHYLRNINVIFCGDELKNLCLKILTFIVYHLSHFTLYTTPIHFENLTMFEPQNKNAKNIVSRYNFCCTT